MASQPVSSAMLCHWAIIFSVWEHFLGKQIDTKTEVLLCQSKIVFLENTSCFTMRPHLIIAVQPLWFEFALPWTRNYEIFES